MKNRWKYIMMLAMLLPMIAVGQDCDNYFSNLKASYTHCQYGLYTATTGASAWTNGRVDYGADDARSRHVIHDEKGKYDIRTLNSTDPVTGDPVPNGLLEVPAGEEWSVRIGNWQDGTVNTSQMGEAERITYDYDVTAAAPYLMLKYAVIWESPNHQDKTPRFKVEVLEDDGTPAAVDCGQIDIEVAQSAFMNRCTWTAYNSVWDDCAICHYWYYGNCYNCEGGYVNQATDHKVYWQDWKSVSIDLSKYVGQRVHIRIMSSDCGYTVHFGYAYFHLKCVAASVFDPKCGDSNSTNTFTAPDGFQYKWYKLDNDSGRIGASFSTDRSVEVQSNNQLYECVLRTPGNTSCDISIYARSEPRLPKADFTATIHKACVDTVVLQSMSYVSPDQVVPYEPYRKVDSVFWDFGDGRVIKRDSTTGYTPISIVYKNDGTYKIRHTAKLTYGDCVHVDSMEVQVRGWVTTHESDVYDTICSGEKYTWNGADYTQTGVYPYVMSGAAGGGFCDSVARLHLKVWDAYRWNDTIDVLEGRDIPYAWHGRNLYTSDVYWDSCKTVHRCDSIYKLVMRVRPKYFIQEKDTICQGDTLLWHGKRLFASNFYYDSLLTRTYGNDSVYQLELFVRPSYHFTESRHFCLGDTVEFHGQRFWTDGPHDVVFHTTKNCDSIYTLVLHQESTYLRDTVVSISDKQKPFYWHGKNCFASGVYFDSLKTVAGCDSVLRLRLSIYPTFFQEDAPFAICQDSTVHWHTKYVKGSTVGTFVVWDSLKNQYGYDSVYKAEVTIRPSYRVNETAQCRLGDTYYWHGQEITAGGVYYYNGNTALGCDSIVKLTIAFWPSYHQKDTASICAGSSYTYHKNRAAITYSVPGTYWDSLKTIHGYDSVFQLTLIQNPKRYYESTATICEGEGYSWHGNEYTIAGVYWDSLQTAAGCDSVFKLTLNVKPRYEKYLYVDRAQGDTYYFFGTPLTTGGPYSYTFPENATRCDSVIRLFLTFHPTYLIPETATICQGQGYTYHKNGSVVTYSEQGIYWDSLKTVQGFDSIYRLELKVNRSYHFTEAFTICEGDTLHRHGQAFTEQRTYTVPFLTSTGCDSIFTLTLTVNPKFETMIYRTICEGEHVMFAGQSRSVGGVYTEKLYRTTGCDSITHLNLTVNPTIRRDEDIHLCGGDYFNFKGRHITTAGTYVDSLHSGLTGCDSLHTYHVFVHPVVRDTDSISICQGEHYLFHGNTFSTSGTHVVPGQSRYGCDSTYVLVLNVKKVYQKDTTFTLCHGDYISFLGSFYDHGGEYHDTIASSLGCDSIYKITINEHPKFLDADRYSLCKGDTFYWHGKQITAAGIYYDSLRSVVSGCDSVYRMTVNMKDTLHTTIVATKTYPDYYDLNGRVLDTSGIYYERLTSQRNGCDSVVEVRLTVNPTFEVNETHEMCEGTPYIWNGQTLTETGNYTAHLQSIFHTDSIVHLALTVYPRIVRDLPTIHISDQETHTWHGHTYTSTETYSYDTTSLVTGCDSTTRLRVVVHPTYRFDDYDTICGNQYYTWNKNGSSYNVAGEYIYNPKTNYWNYDSIYVLHLETRPTYTRNESATLCDGDFYSFHGKPLSEGGHYVDTIPTANGSCDSITHLYLTKLAVGEVSETHTICQGDEYVWHGRTLTTQNVYFDTLRYAATGCDSVRYTLTLKVNKRFYQPEEVTTCANHPVTWRGRSLNQTGVYYDSLQSVFAPFCDSVYCLKLTVKPIFDTIIFDTICEGQQYEFGGIYYADGGVYRQTYTAQNGCDSTVELRLTRKPITRINLRFDLCEKDTFTFHGVDYTTGGLYRDTTTSVLLGCDSITVYDVRFHPVTRDTLYAETCEGVPFRYYGHELYNPGQYNIGGQSQFGCDSMHVLFLSVQPLARKDTVVTLCSGDSKTIFGQVYTRGGTYWDTLYTTHGCDSVIYTIIINEDAHESISSTWSLCKGDYYDWRGQRITSGGIYRDTVFHASGCHDVYELIVTLRQPAYQEVVANIPSTTYYDLNGRILREDGIYDDTIPNAAANGCDSIIHLELMITPRYYTDDQQHICIGQTYYFNGELLDTAGIYTTTYHPKPGVDSIVTLNLTVFSPIIHEQVEHISDRETFTWKGHELNRSGTYDSVYTSVITECDSIDRLRLFVHPTYEYPTSKIMCQGESFSWRRYNGLNTSGIYYDSLRTDIWNLDSVYILDLTVNPSYRHDTTVHMCAGDYYEFGGEARYDGGYYTQNLTTTKGCDSVFTLTLIKHPTHIIEERKTICSDEEYLWRGQVLTDAGVYDDSLVTENYQCDSIHRLVLSVHNTFYQEYNEDICEGEYFNFHGRQLNRSGVYWDSLVTPMNRCDSVYKLTLSVHQNSRQEVYDTICGTEYVMFGGRAIHEGGTYIDSLLTIHGCDSIVILHLLHYPVPFTRVTKEICRGDSVTWTKNGEPIVLYIAGTYTDTLVSRISGCDSVVELRLSVYNTYYFEMDEQICSNTFFNFNGRLLNESGLYWDSLTTVHSGCDSIFRLRLTVHPAYSFDTTIYICDWEQYYFAGRRITETGVYYDRLATHSGCDSTYTLHAFIQSSRRDSSAQQLCLGDTYDFHGMTLTSDGIYRDTIADPITRQCIITIVNLGFVAQTYLSYVQADEACADDQSFIIHSNYTGARPTTYSLVFDDAAHAVGFRDVLDAPYDEHVAAPIPQRDASTYVRPDYYRASLTVSNSVCVPDSLSTAPVLFLLRYPSWIIEQNWNDVVALLNEDYNGGYKFSAYEWVVNNSPTGHKQSYLYLPESLGNGDEVSILLTRAGETHAVPSCPIVIYDKSPELVSTYPVLAHPTGMPGQIRLMAQVEGEYTLYSAAGQRIAAGSYRAGEELYLQTNGVEACYILRLSTPSHGVQTKKMIVR